ncbi:MAG: type IV pilin N-terminal domain-containing protein [Candidatus Methanoperedens sp.]|nr:type IV pilin N-terminal domain-containing protein [Candidatus Methanoperedens sp.]MCZ7405462.1 type IV pilin N-terminal domain-containing protein [Candidatus Methanoperedens sp.]
MRNFRVDEYAVSPVIGVVVMVGMTVIMVSAVTVSVFSFSIPERAPQARIVVVEAKGDTGTTALYKNSIVLKHKGGDALNENATKIIITGKGYTYTTGGDPHLSPAHDMRVTYKDLAGENCISECDNEIVAGTTWDAGETVTLYGSDGRDFELYGWHNNVDSKWKLDDGSTVSVTVIDTITNQVIATSWVTVKHP